MAFSVDDRVDWTIRRASFLAVLHCKASSILSAIMLLFDRLLSVTVLLFISFFLLHTNATPSVSRFTRQSPRDPCPTQCGPSGFSPANWTVYHDLDTLNMCKRPLLLNFVLGAPLSETNSPLIRACSVWGDPARRQRGIFPMLRLLRSFQPTLRLRPDLIRASPTSLSTTGLNG